jgi:Fur family peroxide stress response transcriptional regulator
MDMHTLLHDHGLRVTPQRLAIAEQLLAEARHVVPQEVYEGLKARFPSMSLNTVYMTLSQFEESGLLQRIYVDGRAVFDSNTMPHDHAFCRNCGALADLPQLDETEVPAGVPSGWKVEGYSRLWSGLCPACCKQNKKN